MRNIMVLLASQYDQSRFFKAADLTVEKKLRIKNVTEELVGADRDKEKKLVVWFTNHERGLVLNRINNRTIRGAFGDTVDSWTGKIIVVFPTMAEFRGKMGPALRVRIPPPKQAAASSSGNGAAATVKPADHPIEDVPAKPLADDLNDEILG
jgi:hypothetical protein